MLEDLQIVIREIGLSFVREPVVCIVATILFIIFIVSVIGGFIGLDRYYKNLRKSYRKHNLK